MFECTQQAARHRDLGEQPCTDRHCPASTRSTLCLVPSSFMLTGLREGPRGAPMQSSLCEWPDVTTMPQGNPATVPAQNLRPRAGRPPATAASDGGSDGNGAYGQPDAENLSFLELLAFEDDDGGGYHPPVPTTVVRPWASQVSVHCSIQAQQHTFITCCSYTNCSTWCNKLW